VKAAVPGHRGRCVVQPKETAPVPHSRIRRYLRHGTLPQLAVVEASARLKSFTRAADELHLAQPTVSAQMRKLAETLGAPLFEQVGRNIRLTEPGRLAYAHCLEVLQAFERLDESLASLRQVNSGELRLAIAGAATCFVTRMVAGFNEEHPDVSIAVRIDNCASLRTRLAAREDDLYLFAHAPDVPDVVRQAVLANPLVVVGCRTHRWARARGVSLAELAREPLVIREPGSGTRACLLDLFARAGLTPNVRMELGSDDALRSAVAQGAGVAVLARNTFAPPGSAPMLAELDVAGFPLARQWHFAYPAQGRLSATAEAFLRYVREASVPCPAPAWAPAPEPTPARTAWAIAASTVSSSPIAARSST